MAMSFGENDVCANVKPDSALVHVIKDATLNLTHITLLRTRLANLLLTTDSAAWAKDQSAAPVPPSEAPGLLPELRAINSRTDDELQTITEIVNLLESQI